MMIIKVKDWKFQLCEGQVPIVVERPTNGFWEGCQNWVVTPPSLGKTFLQPYLSLWHNDDRLQIADHSVAIPSDVKELFLEQVLMKL